MDKEIIILLVILNLLALVQVVLLLRKKPRERMLLDSEDKAEIKSAFSDSVGLVSASLKMQSEGATRETRANLTNMSEKIKENREMTETRLLAIEQKLDSRLERMQEAMEQNLFKLQTGNERKLSEIQQTVDEKLTKTLNDRFNESFKTISEELDKVNRTVGEMQKISAEVGSLSKTLSNVKTTGIFGEIQLGAILDEMLSPCQFVKNAVTNPAGRDPVEFAIKLPGTGGGDVLLPIDSKFPYTVYTDMQRAYEQGDFDAYEGKKKQLQATVKSMAKDICEKYICTPHTTNFAIMFLPIESLYAEVLKLNLVGELQQKYKVTVAGPTTMSALLNSLQMGFQTLEIQKKSNDVYNTLAKVKAEFSKYNGNVEKIQKKLDETAREFDQLVGVRTRSIERSLRGIEALELPEEMRD